MALREVRREFSPAAFWAGLSTFIWMVFGALTLQMSVIQQFGISDNQAQSWIFTTWMLPGLVSFWFILRYRQPLAIGWTIPGLVYMASLSDRFTIQEFVAANLVAGVAILVLGALGVAQRVLHIVPMPILMGMFAASIIGFITRLVEATTIDVAVVGPMVAAYLLGRWYNNPRVPPVGLAVVLGAILILILGRASVPEFELALPALATPGATFSPEAILTISVPMVVLVLGLGNVQALGYLEAQGYEIRANPLTVAIGGITAINALFGGHPASMTRVASAILGGPSAGPLAQRYWAALVAYVGVLVVALASGLIIALVLVLPPAYVFAVAGLAIFAAFEDALGRAFNGSLRFGSVVAFGVTLSTVVVAGIPSAFWALPAGIIASLILEREELLATWRPIVAEPV